MVSMSWLSKHQLLHEGMPDLKYTSFSNESPGDMIRCNYFLRFHKQISFTITKKNVSLEHQAKNGLMYFLLSARVILVFKGGRLSIWKLQVWIVSR